MKRILSLVLAVLMLASMATVLSACDLFGGGGEKVGVGEYTYNTYASTFPTTWNPHTYQTATDSTILDYTTVGFYTFDYNETKDGFVVVPDMATSMPVDVTADYVGEEWGIEEDEDSRAWKITLRSDLKWEDGTPITAHDFVTSAQLLLNPTSNNYRADQLYKGDLELVGAEDYFYGGKSLTMPATDVYTEYSESNDSNLIFNIGPKHKGANGVSYFRNWFETAVGAPADYSLEKTFAFFKANYLDKADAFTLEAVTAMEGKTLAEIKADPVLKAAWDALIGWWQTEPNEELHFFLANGTYPETAWETVGIRALSDTELVLILASPLSGFYLHYNLTGSWLVKEDLYRACESTKDGVYNNSYGTSKETFMSYGPYKIESYQQDKQWVLVKNDQWYGHHDHPELYQTTKIVCDWIEKPETAMLAFLQGKLDSKGLDANQSGDYLGSEHLYHSEGSSTFFIALNPNEAAFAKWEESHPGEDKSILAVKEFRMALSFALDRTAFLAACDPTGSVAYSVFNNQICSDPETGTMYRTTEQAKDTLLNFWGISQDDIGAGKKFATKDEAIASITGYNLAAAKELFNQAYDYVIAEDLMEEGDKVVINIGTPNATTAFYTNGYEFLKNNYTEAVKGTKLEGKLVFTNDSTLGNGFSDALKGNSVDLLFGVGWQGSALDPFGLIEAYTTAQYQYDPSWDTSREMITVEIDGVSYVASVLDWTNAINGTKIEIAVADENGLATDEVKNYSCGLNDNRPEERLHVLAALENAVLQTYDMIPLNNDAGVSLKGMQIKYYTEEEVYGLGRGGIKYMTYNMDDYDWDQFVKSQGGTLNYK